MAQIDKTFPTLDCAACILTPKMVEAAQQENIKIYSYSEVEEVKGFVGNFTVKIKKKARYVNEDICTGCGLCTEKCPMKRVPNEFNLGMDNRHAIYIPFAQAVPKVATIDPTACIKLKQASAAFVQQSARLRLSIMMLRTSSLRRNMAQSLLQPDSIRFPLKNLTNLRILKAPMSLPRLNTKDL